MTASLNVRRATRDDLPVIVAMLADDELGAAREDASTPLDSAYMAAFDAIEADPHQLLLVGELHGVVVGTLQLSFLPGLTHKGTWRGQIEAVRVASTARGQGLGEQLIGHAVELCREQGCRMVQLTSTDSRTDAHRFYKRLGWDKSHIGFKLPLGAA